MRGFTILAMALVNDLSDFAPVKDVPQWLRHMESGVDGFTFVDMVVPVFMCILGISIPLALVKRLKRNEPLTKVIGHVLIRSVSLIIMGLMDVNRAVPSLGRPYGIMLDWPLGLWKFLAWTCIFLVWLDIPLKSGLAVTIKKIARIAGLLGLVWLAVVFRTTKGGTFTTGWWGTLGHLGWAYLFASLTWLVFRNNRLGIIGVFVLMHSAYIGMENGLLHGCWLVDLLGKSILGTSSANAVAGLFIGSLLTEDSGGWEKIRPVLGLAFFTASAALLLRPVGGLHSPSSSWSLWSTTCAALLWILLYWLTDIRGRMMGLDYIRTVGKNSLLLYQFSRYWIFLYWLSGLTFYETLGGNTATGITRAILYTVFLGAITVLLTKKRVLLRV